jgi:glycosyltransferase involved in cell wall biosynthesis
MVGTLEPRKGHAEVLAAFELLWSTGVEMNLAIVGRPGWKTEDLQDTLRNHPLLRKRLFWFWNATDEEVERLYQACTGVVVASRAEGFGLPLIEALGYGKPVLARDIPVLHTVSSCRVDYFPADATAGLLAATIARWLAAANAATAPPDVASLPTWRDSARHMVRTLAEAG